MEPSHDHIEKTLDKLVASTRSPRGALFRFRKLEIVGEAARSSPDKEAETVPSGGSRCCIRPALLCKLVHL